MNSQTANIKYVKSQQIKTKENNNYIFTRKLVITICLWLKQLFNFITRYSIEISFSVISLLKKEDLQFSLYSYISNPRIQAYSYIHTDNVNIMYEKYIIPALNPAKSNISYTGKFSAFLPYNIHSETAYSGYYT